MSQEIILQALIVVSFLLVLTGIGYALWAFSNRPKKRRSKRKRRRKNEGLSWWVYLIITLLALVAIVAVLIGGYFAIRAVLQFLTTHLWIVWGVAGLALLATFWKFKDQDDQPIKPVMRLEDEPTILGDVPDLATPSAILPQLRKTSEKHDMSGVGFCNHDHGRALLEKYNSTVVDAEYWGWFCPLCECWWNERITTFWEKKEDILPKLKIGLSYEVDSLFRSSSPCVCKTAMEDPGFNPGFCMFCGGQIAPADAIKVLKICSHMRKYGHGTTTHGFLGLGSPHCTRCDRDLCDCGGSHDRELWDGDKCLHCGKTINPSWPYTMDWCTHLLPNGRSAVESPWFGREHCTRCGRKGCERCGGLQHRGDCEVW